MSVQITKKASLRQRKRFTKKIKVDAQGSPPPFTGVGGKGGRTKPKVNVSYDVGTKSIFKRNSHGGEKKLRKSKELKNKIG